jgi:hypothetical protein
MQEVVRSLSEHPLAAIGVCFAVLLLLYFLFKSLIKLALVMIIVAVAIGGFYYFRQPPGKPADFKEAMEKGREMVGKGKEVIEKGREMVDEGMAVMDAGIEKGKKAVDRGKVAADEIGKILGGEREAGKK